MKLITQYKNPVELICAQLPPTDTSPENRFLEYVFGDYARQADFSLYFCGELSLTQRVEIGESNAGATFRVNKNDIAWSTSLMSLRDFFRTKSCFLHHSPEWSKTAYDMAMEMSLEIHPELIHLMNPPCISGEKFRHCVFPEQALAIVTGDNPTQFACPLFLHNYAVEIKRDVAKEKRQYSAAGGTMISWSPTGDKVAGNEAEWKLAVGRARDVWQRNPWTGALLGQ